MSYSFFSSGESWESWMRPAAVTAAILMMPIVLFLLKRRKKYECEPCGLIFDSESELREHTRKCGRNCQAHAWRTDFCLVAAIPLVSSYLSPFSCEARARKKKGYYLILWLVLTDVVKRVLSCYEVVNCFLTSF